MFFCFPVSDLSKLRDAAKTALGFALGKQLTFRIRIYYKYYYRILA